MRGKPLSMNGSKKLYQKSVGKVNKKNLNSFQKQNTRGGTRF